jgi:hypothetical protein
MSSRVLSFDRFLREGKRPERQRVADTQPLFGCSQSRPARVLNNRQLAHRQRMLDHLRRYRRATP